MTLYLSAKIKEVFELRKIIYNLKKIKGYLNSFEIHI